MFLPGSLKDQQANSAEESQRKAAFDRIERWAIEIIPPHLRQGAIVNVQEVQCGDPDCSPIDTAIAIIFEK